MDSAPQQHQRTEALPDEAEAEGEARASVHLTRFTIHPDRRVELVEAARSPASSTEVPVGSHWELLVELEDGDWLALSITSPGQDPDDAPVYPDVVEGIIGDEDGAIVGCARVDGQRPAAARTRGAQ